MNKLFVKSKKIIFIFLVIYSVIVFMLNVGVVISSSTNNLKAWTIAYGVLDSLFLLAIITSILIKVYLKEFDKKDIFIYLIMLVFLLSGVLSGTCIGLINKNQNLLTQSSIPIWLSIIYWLSLVGNGISVLFCVLFTLKEFNIFSKIKTQVENKELNKASFGSL